MLKKVIKHEDFFGNERETTAYFHLSQEELLKLEMSFKGGLDAELERMSASENQKELLDLFSGLMGDSYGVIEDDGAGFDKSPEHFEKFKRTAAYQALFDEVMFSVENAVTFFRGIMPKALRDKLDVAPVIK